ncbi:MAG: PilZ domain-containing protein [Pseudomonadota bacterium]
MTALAEDNAIATPAAISERERRRHRRLDLRIGGRFMNESSDEFRLRTINISCSGAFMEARQRPPLGANVVCYFDGLGRVAATVVRRTAEGFAVLFRISPFKRDKLADRLTWLLNKDALGLAEDREAPRHAASGPAVITRQDGSRLQCRVLDISLTGAGFETDGAAPMIGEIIQTGNLRGEVVRRTEKGFGVRFLHGPSD